MNVLVKAAQKGIIAEATPNVSTPGVAMNASVFPVTEELTGT